MASQQSVQASPSAATGSSSLTGAPPSSTPLWAVQLSLQAILLSIQQLSDAHSSWSSLSSNTLSGIPSFGLDERTRVANQPSLEEVKRWKVPVEGEAWEQYRDQIKRNAEAIKGIRSFRTAVLREKDHIDQVSERMSGREHIL